MAHTSTPGDVAHLPNPSINRRTAIKCVKVILIQPRRGNLVRRLLVEATRRRALPLHHPRPQSRRANRPVIDAIKLIRPGDGDPRADFTYCVVKPKDAGDKRSARRRRTRLRSGKLLDPRNALLIDCQIYDRSEKGARIRLIGECPVPRSIRLYEEFAGAASRSQCRLAQRSRDRTLFHSQRTATLDQQSSAGTSARPFLQGQKLNPPRKSLPWRKNCFYFTSDTRRRVARGFFCQDDSKSSPDRLAR